MNQNANGRSWVEISLGTVLRNCEIYRACLPEGTEVMAVVKADAYGHGDEQVAGALWQAGVRHFAVSNLEEALRVRQVVGDAQILILGYTPVEKAEALVRGQITQALLSREYAQALAARGLPVLCQYALDTGMRRIGLDAEDPEACEQSIRACPAPLRLTGLFTHLCVADTPAERVFTERQIALFNAVCSRVRDLHLPWCHCMNSAGGLWYRSAFSSLARLGIVLYGLKPDRANTLPPGIQPALAWKSVISMVKTVRPGDTVGYGRTFTVERPMRIATIPTGYADGYSRLLSGRGWVLICGRRAPLVGRICMDQMMADVSRIPQAAMGTEVVLIGRSGEEVLTADDLAGLYGTIGYEVVCGISKRVERVYLQP